MAHSQRVLDDIVKRRAIDVFPVYVRQKNQNRFL